jgi:hypothetical protein
MPNLGAKQWKYCLVQYNLDVSASRAAPAAKLKPWRQAPSREEKWQVAPAEPAVIFDPKTCTENDFWLAKLWKFSAHFPYIFALFVFINSSAYLHNQFFVFFSKFCKNSKKKLRPFLGIKFS